MMAGRTPRLVRRSLAVLLGACCIGVVQPAEAKDFPHTQASPSLDLQAPIPDVQTLIEHGMEYLGIRYRKGGSSPATGLDCSGLVQNVFRNALGIDLPRTASDMARLGDKIQLTELRPGDLVFFNTMRRAFSHVGIYLGSGQFLHAPSSGGVVRVDRMNGQYWTARFNGARRLLSANDN